MLQSTACDNNIKRPDFIQMGWIQSLTGLAMKCSLCWTRETNWTGSLTVFCCSTLNPSAADSCGNETCTVRPVQQTCCQHKPAHPTSRQHVHISVHSRETVMCYHKASSSQLLTYYLLLPYAPLVCFAKSHSWTLTLKQAIQSRPGRASWVECTHKRKGKYHFSINNNLLHT